ncbi:C-C motif chemokine 20 [Amia ocellicauda]|uniref:C-C motif chemokine 20 n=1 Tax=Amia ocellicauda TaxID=2972642 RepID=UPI003464DB03
MAVKFFCLALLGLVALSLFALQTEAGPGSCCLSYSKNRLPCKVIKGYTIQSVKDNCNIDAILFHTNGGKTLCHDPSKAWVMERIHCLKKKAENMA